MSDSWDDCLIPRKEERRKKNEEMDSLDSDRSRIRTDPVADEQGHDFRSGKANGENTVLGSAGTPTTNNYWSESRSKCVLDGAGQHHRSIGNTATYERDSAISEQWSAKLVLSRIRR